MKCDSGIEEKLKKHINRIQEEILPLEIMVTQFVIFSYIFLMQIF